jgi:hypothetical protein
MFRYVLYAGANIRRFPEVSNEELSCGAELRHSGAVARFLQFRGFRAWPLIGAMAIRDIHLNSTRRFFRRIIQ